MHKKTVQKVAAILLTVVLVAALFPAALFAQAEETPDVKPFYLVNWDRGFTTNDYSNVYWMPYTWTKIYAEGTAASLTDWYYPGEGDDLGYIKIGLYFNGNKSTSNIDTAAQWLYEEFSQRPAGTRYINLAALGTVFRALCKDVIDFEDSIQLVSNWLEEFLTKYKALGGELDGIAIDLEYNSYTSFYLQSNNCVKYDEDGVTKDPKNVDVLQDIVRNERVYQAKIRPQLQELAEQGLFQFYTGGTCKVYDEETGKWTSVTTTIDETTGLPDNLGASLGSVSGYRVPIPVSEITTINRYDGDGGVAISRSTWSSVLQRHIVNCIDRAVYEPMIEYYPDAILSDYSHEDLYAWNVGFSGTGSTGTGAKAGNASNGVYYGGSMGEYFYATGSGSTTRQLYYKPVGQDAAVYEPVTPYSMALREINNHKGIVASAQQAGTEHTNAWVAYFNYASNSKSYGNTAYYSEVLYHLGLTDPEPYFGYIIASEVKSKGTKYFPDDPNMADFEYALGVTNELLAELTRVAGASDREPIVTPVEWDDGFVVSGMYAGGRNIWRVTPDTTKISVEDFKVDGKNAPTFSVNGVTITFPQGRIIEDSDITQVGTCGYWVETPADVNPVITKSANHYEENPSFGETFERYNLGEFTAIRYSIDASQYSSAYRPDTYWTVSGSASIVENNGSKGMALTGTTTLTNASSHTSAVDGKYLTVPAQITAGDSYAKQQAWEVTVTMPSSFSGTIQLLSYNTSYDGFQITSSGQVRYPYIYSGGTSGYFSSMGLTLTAGQTYTFKRVLDFSANTGSYYVYDANGNLLKSLTGKRILTKSQVVSIYNTTSSVTGTVILDDYKLYPVGVTTNLKLYDTVELSQYANYTPLVRSISDTTATRTDKTAYRVSWLNNSGEYKYAVLKNSNTGAVIEKVLMAPGDSGYFTGIVEASASSPVTFVLTQEAATAPTTPDYENGDFTWAGYAENLGICCYVVDQGYAKLEDALAEAKDGQTIVMIADAKLESTAVIDSSVKINTNGHTISLADGFTGDCAIALAAGGNLTWDDGLTLDAGSKTAICVTGGTLNVTGGSIVTTGTAIMTKQDAAKAAIAVNVTGGSVQGAKAFLHTNANATSSENVTVSILATAVTGTVVSEEVHFEMQNSGGIYTLHGHTVNIIPGYAATCTDAGLTDGAEYPCCNKTLAQVAIPALGGEHNWQTAPCSTAMVCTRCGDTDQAGTANHTYGAGVVTPPTCTEDGYTTYTCTTCGDSYTDNPVAATGHVSGAIYVENSVLATCTTDGSYDNVTYCTVCKAEVSRQTVTIGATGHTPGEVVVENEVAITCTDDGSYDNVRYCETCQAEATRETVIIPAPEGGHDEDGFAKEIISVGNCTTDDSYDNVVYCTACGYEHSRENIFTPAPGHEFVIGATHITCKNCDYSKEIGTSTLTIASGNNTTPVIWKPKLTPEMDAAYAKTVDGIIVTEGASASDWNLKVEWPAGGKPTLTLKDATINNDTRYVENQYSKYDTITIGGSADFVILLEGANYLNGRPNAADGNVSAYACPIGIAAYNTGDLTIRGTNKATDGLYLDNKGGNAIDCRYNALTVENATLDIKLHSTSNGYPQNGILMQYYAAGYEDKTNLTVRNSNFSINVSAGGGNPYASKAIIFGKSSDTQNAANTGDLLFQNSTVYINRNNSSGQTSPIVATGANNTITFDRCDMATCYSWRVVFDYVPKVINCENVSYTSNANGATTYTDALAGTKDPLRSLKMTHTCLAGEPVVETITKGDCYTSVETVTYCVMCNARTVLESVDTSTKAHTPGAKVELEDQRVGVIGTGTMSKFGLVPKSEGSSYYKPATGKYVFQYTCSVCGETWTEEETFKPAILYFITSGKGASYDSANDRYNYNSHAADNTSSSYKPTVAIGPGQVKYYTTGEYDANNPGYSYMKALTDETEIAAGNWNVKFEYPLYSDPVLTLKNANIANASGLWYGVFGYNDVAPLTIVLEGENSIKQLDRAIGGGPLMLHTNNDVTITGDGTLLLQSHTCAETLSILRGNLTLDNVDITLTRENSNATSSREAAIGSSTAGNVTINGGSITYTGFGYNRYTSKDNGDGTYTKTYSETRPANLSLIQGTNVTINNATITAHGTFRNGKDYGIIKSTGDMTIRESTILLAQTFVPSSDEYAYYQGYAAYGIVCGGTLTWDYANGITGKYSYENTLADDYMNPTYTYPDEATFTDITPENLADAITYRLVQIAPAKALESFTGTAVTVKDDLDVSFKLDAEKVDTKGTVKFTVNGVETTKPLSEVGAVEGADYVVTLPGLSAKEMASEITVTIYDSEGNTLTETKSDSVVAYAQRLLRDNKYADDTVAENKALKTFLVDMLIYGSMAQVQFEHEVNDLPTAILTAAEWAYASTELKEEVAKTPAETSAKGYLGTTFELKSNIGMAVALDANVVGDVTHAVVTFTDYLGSEKEFTVTQKDASSTDRYTIFVFNELTAANGRQTVTWTFYDANGNVKLTVSDSLADYVGRMRETHPYMDELMKYCDSAKTYFSIVNAQ